MTGSGRLSSLLSLLSLLSLSLPGCKGNGPSPGASPSSSFHWPVPEGWKQETIPFPLDPFKKGNGREISLNLRVAIGDCPEAGRQAVLVTASPRPRGDAIWKALAEREASFRCP